MATDYDAPRRRAEDEIETDSLEGLKAAENVTNDMDDDGEIVEPFDLPSVDVAGEELNATVIPRRENELAFTAHAFTTCPRSCDLLDLMRREGTLGNPT